MKLSRRIMGVFLTVLMTLLLLPSAMEARAANMFVNSDFIETEQPVLSEETTKLISLYQKTPTEENYLNLRDMVTQNYDAVLERKEAKLAELKTETAGKPGGEAIVAEMEGIVQEMYVTYWSRINSSMLRFTDTRLLKWKISNASQYAYIPVMGAGESIYVGRTPVTNEEYAKFIKAAGVQTPSNWTNGTYPEGEDRYPVNFVSFEDAKAYCVWLTEQDSMNAYRLPTESEWELAAGHMPKDAEFNCGVKDGRTPVEQYEGITRGAHGAIDFWGNVWEWTSTARYGSNGSATLGVKGGAWFSDRTACRTEHRKENRDAAVGYEDVGFRVIQVRNGEEPEQKVELATLGAPVVSAISTSPDSIALSWQPVDGAIEYQLFEYFDKTGLIQMLGTVEGTSVTMRDLEPGSTHRYIVQPISYTEIADNVSPENSVKATCGGGGDSSFTDSSMEVIRVNGLNCWLYTPNDVSANMPLIVYLHGISGKGDDPNTLLTSEGFVQWLADGTLGEVSAYVLIPQVPSSQKDWLAMQETVASAIGEAVSVYQIDSSNISLTGFSMGGTGVWGIAVSYPELFRCIAPCSGGVRTNQTTLSALRNMKIWTFIGTEDTTVKPQPTINFMAQLTRVNAQVVMTKFDGAMHTDVPALAYLSKEIDLIHWLIGK